MDHKWRKIGNNNQEDIVDSWVPELNGTLVGKYLNQKNNIGKNNSTIYIFEKEDGEKIGVWSSAVIDIRIKEAKVGDTIKFVYLGKQTNPKTGRVFKNFDVFIDDAVVEPKNEVSTKKKIIKQDKDGEDIPF